MDGVSYHSQIGFAIVGWEETGDGMLDVISDVLQPIPSKVAHKNEISVSWLECLDFIMCLQNSLNDNYKST